MFSDGSSNSGEPRKKTEPKRRFVVLTVTERCNLDCVYCFERAKGGTVMDLRVAKEALEHEFAHSDAFDEIQIELFGGEPTLCKEFLMELVKWVEERKFHKPTQFFLETNGTLVHGEFQAWLLKNKHHVKVGLSLDGTPETHNANRSNSYGKIDVAFFATNYPEHPVRITIHSRTVGRLCEDVVHLHSLGFRRIDASLACGIEWDTANVSGKLRRELEKLSDYYLEHPELDECSLFDIGLPELLRKGAKLPQRCGAGTSMVSVGTDGRRYPCHTFQPNTTANPVEQGEIDFNGIEDFRDTECSGCVLEPSCPTCYGINHRIHGNVLKRDRQYCAAMKIRALAVSYLRGKQIEKGARNMQPAELYQTVKAIHLVQEAFATV